MERSMKKLLAKTVVAATLTGVLLGLGGCVSEDQYQRLQTAYDQSQAQLAAAQAQLQKLRHEMSSIEAQIATDNTLLNAHKGGLTSLLKERNALEARLANLKAKYNKLLALAGQAPQLPKAVSNALSRLADEYPNLLEFNKKLGLLRFKSDLLFALGSTKVRPQARKALKDFAKILDMHAIADNEIRIVGNTDNVPIRRNSATVMNPTNWYLSTNRAIAVMYVLKHFGVIDRRMQVAGWGKTHPIAANAPQHRGNPLNRRVDIFITPIKIKYNPYVPASEQVVSSGTDPALTPASSTPNMTGGNGQ